MTRTRCVLESENGQTLTEYAIIIGVVSISAIVALEVLGNSISDVFTDVASTINAYIS